MSTCPPRPMLATLGSPPDDSAGFAVEAKYDGQRGLAIVSGGAVTLWSRNGANITDTFPEITAALPEAVAGRPVILDGEIVALDKDGVPSFGRLRRRWPQNRRPDAQLLRDVPVRFYVFDILAAQGHSLAQLPYVQRRRLLTAMAEDRHTPVVRIPPCWTDVQPQLVLDASAELGLEGIVCKRLDSPYLAGRRSAHWIKTPLRRRSPFVIGGWLPGIGANHQSVGALLVGAHGADGQLHFCGVVGAGISGAQRRHLGTHRRGRPAA
ncbi:MAG: ATP-dependent DNA ligase [Mycobacterium sp.]